jgi:hypothetical protein
MATEESLALQRAEAKAAELSVLKSIDDRLGRIEDKLGIGETEAAPVPTSAPVATKPPAFKPVTKAN